MLKRTRRRQWVKKLSRQKKREHRKHAQARDKGAWWEIMVGGLQTWEGSKM